MLPHNFVAFLDLQVNGSELAIISLLACENDFRYLFLPMLLPRFYLTKVEISNYPYD